MAANNPATSKSLAEQALSNLVNQFARPMDFLRELVQNSIDAGTPRIDVYVDWDADEHGAAGVLQIHVDDHGEGMDEGVIDSQLTRLFSSTKEDDLTKIGKFGIGFTSIFAIRPDLVLLRTGRHGECWELVFHADRTFEKRPLAEPLTGTKITLYKRMSASEAERTVQEARFILTYWCEHSSVPITFEDRTTSVQTSSDPFAAFTDGAEQTAVETISRPLGLLGAQLEVLHRTEAVTTVVAYVEKPRYGFYNGGLTLISSEQPEVLGDHAERLAHLAFKVQYNALEHTLTRDNVLQDEHWETAMAAVTQSAQLLRARLLDRIDAASPPELERLLHHLATETELSGGHSGVRAWWGRERAIFSTQDAHRVSLEQVEAQERALGVVLLDPGPGRFRDTVVGEGYTLLADSAATHRLLLALQRPAIMGLFAVPRSLVSADRFFVMPEVVELPSLPSTERLVVQATAALLAHATGGRLTIRIGEFGGPAAASEEHLALEGPRDAVLFRRPSDPWVTLPSWLRWRSLLVNRHHAHFRAQVVAAGEDLQLAAFALAQALLVHEDVVGDAVFDLLLEAAG